MARDEQRQRIVGHSAASRANRFRIAGGPCQIGIGARTSERYPSASVQDHSTKRRLIGIIKRDIKPNGFSLKVGLHLLDNHRGRFGFISLQKPSAYRASHRSFRKWKESRDKASIPACHNAKRTERRWNQ